MDEPPRDTDRSRIRSRRRHILEAYLAAVPLSVALAFAVSILVPAAVTFVFAGAFAIWFAGSVIVPLLLVVDGRETGRSVSRPVLILAGLVLPLPTLCIYLRRDPAPTPPGRFASSAWIMVAAGIGGWLAFFAGEIVALYGIVSGTGVTISGITVLLPGAIGLILLGVLPFAVYADTKYVRENGTGWAPSPALRYLLTLVFYSPLALVLPLYVGYHLGRRYRALEGPP